MENPWNSSPWDSSPSASWASSASAASASPLSAAEAAEFCSGAELGVGAALNGYFFILVEFVGKFFLNIFFSDITFQSTLSQMELTSKMLPQNENNQK